MKMGLIEYIFGFVFTIFTLLIILCQIILVVAFFSGIYHAFSASVITGMISLFLPFTPIIEIIDWFHPNEIWVDIANFLNKLVST